MKGSLDNIILSKKGNNYFFPEHLIGKKIEHEHERLQITDEYFSHAICSSRLIHL